MSKAAIDLGSNSFICYIFENHNDELVQLDDKVILTRLSEGVDKNKSISDDALKRSEDAFKVFHQLFKKYNVNSVQAVATSAARDAKNQKAFLDLALKYDIPIKIISGDEEARLTFLGVSEAFKSGDGLVIDIGGGSTEFIYVSKGQLQDRVSLDIGVVRFSERHQVGSDFKVKENELRAAIKEELSKSIKLQEFRKKNIDAFLAVSGTPTSIASLILNGFNAELVDGFNLSKDDLKQVLKTYCYLSLDERLARFPFVESKRADVLPTGVLILDEALKFFDVEGYTVSTKGIRHGVARSMDHSNFRTE